MKIIIYDDENISYKTGHINRYEYVPDVNYIKSVDGTYQTSHSMTADLNISCYNFEENETIKLDDTMMKRIAKFNKEQEIKEMDEIIKEKERQIDYLEDILTDKSKRVDMIKKYICDIYTIEIDNKIDDIDW